MNSPQSFSTPWPQCQAALRRVGGRRLAVLRLVLCRASAQRDSAGQFRRSRRPHAPRPHHRLAEGTELVRSPAISHGSAGGLCAALLAFFRGAAGGAHSLPLHWLGLPWSGARSLASGLWPLILLGVMFWALRWVGQGFMPRHWTGITAYVALFATSLMFQFTPGRVDHHAIAALLTLLSFGCVTRMMDEPERVKWGLYAGFGLAAGQAIALEILPWLLALSGWVCVDGGARSRDGAQRTRLRVRALCRQRCVSDGHATASRMV